jgi:hypothetical protein
MALAKPMAESVNARNDTLPLDLSVAGWCLLAAAFWELIAGRFASTFGLYQTVAPMGSLACLADSVKIATTAVAILSLTIAATGLVKLCTDERFAALPVRVTLLFASPFALPIIAVSIFRPVQAPLVRVGYLGAVILVSFLMLLTALHPVGGPKRRAAILLGMTPLMQAVALFGGGFAVTAPESVWGKMAHHAAGLAQALYLATPLLLLSFLLPGGIKRFLRRPNIEAMAACLVVAGLLTAGIVLVQDPMLLALSAFRAMGLSLNLSFAPTLYVFSAALTTLVGVSLIRSNPSDIHTRRVGMGILLVAVVGLHQFHPYRLALLLAGFVYLARGLVGPALNALPQTAAPLPDDIPHP